MARRGVWTAMTALVLAGCASTPGAGGSSPPPVVVSGADGEIELAAWSYCWSGAGSGSCADGAPPDNPASVGEMDTVELSFTEPGWQFEATFTERTDADCPRSLTTDAVALSDTTFRLEPVGDAGPWTVDLFGSGPRGDVATTFVWTTTAAAPISAGVDAALAVLANHDGAVDSYGVELFIGGLAITPEEATASVVVSNAVGYTGVGGWSLDLPEGENLHVPLVWTPALPAYEAGQADEDAT